MIKYAFGSVMLLLLLASCGRKGLHIRIDDSMMEHFWYNTGTYWIYRDDATGNMDSVVVVSREILTTGFSDETQTDVGTIVMETYDLASQQRNGGYRLVLKDSHLESSFLKERYYPELLRWPIVDGDRRSGSLGREDVLFPQTGEMLSCRKITSVAYLQNTNRTSRISIDTLLIHDTYGIMKLKTADTAGSDIGRSIVRLSIK